MARAWDAVVLNPEDDVAMALADLVPGTIRIRLGEAIETVTLTEPIVGGALLPGARFAQNPD